MPDSNSTRQALIEIGNKIKSGDYPHNWPNWGGADVVITSKKPKQTSPGFYPEPRFVVTKFSHELSWLFKSLWDVLLPYFDGCTKIEFFGRLANMVIRYQALLHEAEEQEKDLLNAVLHEAFSILDELEEGNFQYLAVAVGNTIFNDLIDEAESEGYLGVERTRQYLEELERRFQDES